MALQYPIPWTDHSFIINFLLMAFKDISNFLLLSRTLLLCKLVRIYLLGKFTVGKSWVKGSGCCKTGERMSVAFPQVVLIPSPTGSAHYVYFPTPAIMGCHQTSVASPWLSCISLITSDAGDYFWMVISHLYSLFSKMSLSVFCPYFY